MPYLPAGWSRRSPCLVLLLALWPGGAASAAAQHRPRYHARAEERRLSFEQVALPGRVRLHVAEQGDPHGQPVILLHGYSDSWFSFSRVLPFLPSNLHVYALDLRGHGESEQPAAQFSMADLAKDVLAFMDLKRLPAATVVGHSMGSFVAQQVALAAPDRVKGLVLIASATTPRHAYRIDDLRRAIEAQPDSISAEFIREFQHSTVYHPVPAQFMDRVISESRKLSPRLWRALMAGMLETDPATELGRHQIPTLILWGERDAIMLRAEQDALLAQLPRARLIVYAATGHAPHWERPEMVGKDLTAFVRAEGK